MKFNINLTNLYQLRDTLNKAIITCENLNNEAARENKILEKMNLTKEQAKLLLELFEE